MNRREFSHKIRLVIVARAMNANGQVVCEGCGQILHMKKYEIDHTIAEALVVDKSKPLTAKDGQLLGMCCHRGEAGKTAKDVSDIARAKRRQAAHLGIKPKSRGFQSKWKRKVSGETVLRRNAVAAKSAMPTPTCGDAHGIDMEGPLSNGGRDRQASRLGAHRRMPSDAGGSVSALPEDGRWTAQGQPFATAKER